MQAAAGVQTACDSEEVLCLMTEGRWVKKIKNKTVTAILRLIWWSTQQQDNATGKRDFIFQLTQIEDETEYRGFFWQSLKIPMN